MAAQAALVFAETFADDPFYQWMTPEPQSRLAALNAYFAVKVADAMARGEAFASESGATVMLTERLGDGTVLEGAALGGAVLGDTATGGQAPTEEVPASLRALLPAIGQQHLDKIREVFATIDSTHPARPHDYVDVLAGSRAVRGGGEGSRLVSDWLTRADAGELAYLQSSNPRNLSFYRRLGFHDEADVIRLPHAAGSLTPMSRIARPAS
ncbi:hypothetical protein [Compostimonas suwonensis]|nr:hypothetical protein [Compostimonas suwonensis]